MKANVAQNIQNSVRGHYMVRAFPAAYPWRIDVPGFRVYCATTASITAMATVFQDRIEAGFDKYVMAHGR